MARQTTVRHLQKDDVLSGSKYKIVKVTCGLPFHGRPEKKGKAEVVYYDKDGKGPWVAYWNPSTTLHVD